MFHFLSAGGKISSDHLRYLREYFEEKGIEYVCHEGVVYGDELVAGDAYLACSILAIDANPVQLESIFEVQLAHNLTGIKGNPFHQRAGDLNIFGGRQVAVHQRLDMSDSRFVLGGYPKWDFIYPERHRVEERRQELASEKGLDPSVPWVCFYPTGPNLMVRGGLARVFEILSSVERKLGANEFLICNHAQNRKMGETKKTLEKIEELLGDSKSFDSSVVGGEGESRVHLVDGSDALRHITACDLFITDVASTLITAVSMGKPVAQIPVKKKHERSVDFSVMLKGAFLKDIDDLKVFVEGYETPKKLRDLFQNCVEFDDDKNCERITQLVLNRYEKWRKERGVK